jgi:hypothetical protein
MTEINEWPIQALFDISHQNKQNLSVMNGISNMDTSHPVPRSFRDPGLLE